MRESAQNVTIVGGPCRNVDFDRRKTGERLPAAQRADGYTRKRNVDGSSGDGGGRAHAQGKSISHHLAIMDLLRPKVQSRSDSLAPASNGIKGQRGKVNAVLAAGDGHRRAPEERTGKRLEGSSAAAGVSVSRRARAMGAASVTNVPQLSSSSRLLKNGEESNSLLGISRSENRGGRGRRFRDGSSGEGENSGHESRHQDQASPKRYKREGGKGHAMSAICQGGSTTKAAHSEAATASGVAGASGTLFAAADEVSTERCKRQQVADRHEERGHLPSSKPTPPEVPNEETGLTPERCWTRRGDVGVRPGHKSVRESGVHNVTDSTGDSSRHGNRGKNSIEGRYSTGMLPVARSSGPQADPQAGTRSFHRDECSTRGARAATDRVGFKASNTVTRKEDVLGAGTATGRDDHAPADEAGLAVAMMDIMSGSSATAPGQPGYGGNSVLGQAHPNSGCFGSGNTNGGSGNALQLATRIVNTVGAPHEMGTGDGLRESDKSGGSESFLSSVLTTRGRSAGAVAGRAGRGRAAKEAPDRICDAGIVAQRGMKNRAVDGSDWHLRASRAVGRVREEAVAVGGSSPPFNEGSGAASRSKNEEAAVGCVAPAHGEDHGGAGDDTFDLDIGASSVSEKETSHREGGRSERPMLSVPSSPPPPIGGSSSISSSGGKPSVSGHHRENADEKGQTLGIPSRNSSSSRGVGTRRALISASADSVHSLPGVAKTHVADSDENYSDRSDSDRSRRGMLSKNGGRRAPTTSRTARAGTAEDRIDGGGFLNGRDKGGDGVDGRVGSQKGHKSKRDTVKKVEVSPERLFS